MNQQEEDAPLIHQQQLENAILPKTAAQTEEAAIQQQLLDGEAKVEDRLMKEGEADEEETQKLETRPASHLEQQLQQPIIRSRVRKSNRAGLSKI